MLSTTTTTLRRTLATFIIGAAALAAASTTASAVDITQTWDMKIVNNTNNKQLSPDDIYVLVKGIDHDDLTKDVLVEYATTGKKGSLVGYCHVTTETKTEDYCYPLSLFPDLTVPLPLLRSGRVYFSLRDKMQMPIISAADGRLTISDATVFPTAMSPSLYTYFQFIEYTWLNVGDVDSDSNGTWVDPSAVDCVSLPIHIAYNGSEGGFKNIDRATILENLKNAFNAAPTKASWNKLAVADQFLPEQTLRICAPGKAIILGSTDPRIVAREFSTTYLDDYISAVWKYYKTSGKAILVDCKEIKGDPANTKYANYTDAELMVKVTVDQDGYMQLTNTPDKNPPIKERLSGSKGQSKPSTFAIFAGDGAVATDPFKVVNHTLSALVIREVCSALEVGLLPQPDDATLNKSFYNAKREAKQLYVTNPLTKPGDSAPWYDLYAATIHEMAPSLYAYAFDDVLGMDGTCHGSRKPTEAVTVTLGDVSDIKFANKPPVDNTLYTALVATTPDIEIDILSVKPVKHVDYQSNSGWMQKVHSPLKLKMRHKKSAAPLTIDVYLKEKPGGGYTILPPHDVVIKPIAGQGLSISPSNAPW